jgi:hypothetical protein
MLHRRKLCWLQQREEKDVLQTTVADSSARRLFAVRLEKVSIQDEMDHLKSAGYRVAYIDYARENDVIGAFQILMPSSCLALAWGTPW